MTNTVSGKSFKFPEHSRIIIAGSSNTGKTQLMLKLLEFGDEIFTKKPTVIIFFYLIYQKVYDKIKEKFPNSEFFDSLDDLSQIFKREKEFFEKNGVIICIDDLYLEAVDSKLVYNLFLVYCHHKQILAVVLTTQNLNVHGKYQVSIGRNCTHLILLKSERTLGSLRYIAKDFGTCIKTLSEVYKLCMTEKYSYLVICFDPDNQYSRFYTGLFPGSTLKSYC